LIAVILIKTEAGRAFTAREAIRQIEGVESTHVVTGPYDIITIIDTKQVNLRSLVTSIHKIRGVVRTETCVSVS
jgi:DNA-binding Lrp family transcriptional regulator